MLHEIVGVNPRGTESQLADIDRFHVQSEISLRRQDPLVLCKLDRRFTIRHGKGDTDVIVQSLPVGRQQRLADRYLVTAARLEVPFQDQ